MFRDDGLTGDSEVFRSWGPRDPAVAVEVVKIGRLGTKGCVNQLTGREGIPGGAMGCICREVMTCVTCFEKKDSTF